MSSLDRTKVRKEILAAVREMSAKYPHADYCYARDQFGLLWKIKAICKNTWPTAKECCEAVGLDRSYLVDEFEFTQADLMERAA
jgi:hypothetical protein